MSAHRVPYLELGLAVLFLVPFCAGAVLTIRDLAREIADRRAGSRPHPGDDERLERIWSYLRPLLVPGRPIPTVALGDGPTSRAVGLHPGRRPRLVFRRGLLEQPSVEVVLGEVAHEYAHTFKPPTMLVVLAAWLLLVVGELVALAVSFWSDAPLLGNPFVALLAFSGVGGYALMARLSQREELRADRHAAELLGSARPVVAMLEQVRRDDHARGIDSDRWRRSDRLLASHPPVEVRIQALTLTPHETTHAGTPHTGAPGTDAR
ncbi:MAG: M48 family metalloprotease [Solirubrobacteraceae bacterium]